MGLEDSSCPEAWMKAAACRAGSGHCTAWGSSPVASGGTLHGYSCTAAPPNEG